MYNNSVKNTKNILLTIFIGWSLIKAMVKCLYLCDSIFLVFSAHLKWSLSFDPLPTDYKSIKS